MKKRKSNLMLLLTILCMIMLVGCKKKEGSSLMKNASPETSVLTFLRLEEQSLQSNIMYNPQKEQDILDSINKVSATKVENWTMDQITYPIYGLSIGAKDGNTVNAAWTNGYWITQDGSVFQFEYDFEKLLENEAWESTDMGNSILSMPCARWLTQQGDVWNKKLLPVAKEPENPDSILMTLDQKEEHSLTVTYENRNDTEWIFGEYYSIQVFLDDTWYEIPPVDGNWGFKDIAYILEGGQKRSKTYNLSMYGELPDEKYRFVANGMAVEF